MTRRDRWDASGPMRRLATMARGGAPYGAIEDGAIAVRGWAHRLGRPARAMLPGADARAARRSRGGAGSRRASIDCHTHLVYGGDRAREFELRLNGASYEEIARAGGGILSTVRATRAASEDELFAQRAPRLRALLAEGVTTIEIKSGYGLDARDRAQDAARRAPPRRRATGRRCARPSSARTRCRRSSTGRADDYVDRRLPSRCCRRCDARRLADAVDAFCERHRASRRRRRARVFEAARALGLPVKLHADQLSDQRRRRARRALRRAVGAIISNTPTRTACAAMARAGTVAVLLPGAFYFLRETQLPPIDALRAHGVPIAIATDCNPGTSPCTVAAADAEHGVHAVPPDARGSAAPASRAMPRARWAWPTAARSRRASAPTSWSGTSRIRRSSLLDRRPAGAQRDS